MTTVFAERFRVLDFVGIMFEFESHLDDCLIGLVVSTLTVDGGIGIDSGFPAAIVVDLSAFESGSSIGMSSNMS